MKIRVSYDIDVTNETTYSSDGTTQRVPITADNAYAWFCWTFDHDEDNFTPGFITNTKVEVIPNT